MDLIISLSGLALFLYGLRLLSGSVQKFSGSYLRGQLMFAPRSRGRGLWSGAVLSGLMFSTAGAAGTVVGLVNSGLYRLPRAYSSMIGVNLGGVVVVWVVSTLGFGLPEWTWLTYGAVLCSLSMFLMLSTYVPFRYGGEVLLGLALIIGGIGLFVDHVGVVFSYESVGRGLAFLGKHEFALLLFWFTVGFIFSLLLSSSVGAFIVALSLSELGYLAPLCGIYIVLGVNLGSAVSVYLGSLKGNQPARRMASYHLIFNIFSALWGTLLLTYFYLLEPRVWGYLRAGSFMATMGYAYLPLVHTVINGSSAMLLLLLQPLFDRLSHRMGLSIDLGRGEVFQLKAFALGLHPTGEISLLQAQEMTLKYARRTYRMFGFVQSLFSASFVDSEAVIERVEKYGRISRRVEREIALFLGGMRWGDLSERGRRQLGSLLRVRSSLETVAQSILSVARVVSYKLSNDLWFNEYVVVSCRAALDRVEDVFAALEELLGGASDSFAYTVVIDEVRTDLTALLEGHRARWTDDLEDALYTAQAGVLLTEVLIQCNRMVDAFFQVARSMDGVVLNSHEPIRSRFDVGGSVGSGTGEIVNHGGASEGPEGEK